MPKKLVIIFSAILIGLVFVSPHFFRASFLKKENVKYSPFALNSSLVQTSYEEMYGYAPEVQEVLRGNLFVHDPYTFENKNIPSPFVGQSFPAVVMAILSKLTGSVPNAFIVSDFIFPALIWLELFWLVNSGTKKFILSLVTATFTLFFLELIYFLPYPIPTLKYLFNPQTHRFLTFMRSFNPQLSFLILLNAYSGIYLILTTKSKKILLLSAVLSGMLFYTYIYYWSTFFFSLLILIIYFLTTRKFLEVKKILIVIFFAGLIGSYYFLQTLLFKQTPMYTDLLTRITPYNLSVLPDFFWRYFLISVAFILWPRKRSLLDWIIFSVMISTVFLPIVFTSILKQDLQGFHFIRRVFFPISIVAMALGASDIRNKLKVNNEIWKLILIIVFIGGIYLSIGQQFYASKNTYQANGINDDTIKLYDWLNQSTPTGSVVGTYDYHFDFAISGNTHNYIFIPPADVALTTQADINDRHEYLNHLFNIGSMTIPQQKLDYVNKIQIRQKWTGKKYRLDYFVWPSDIKMNDSLYSYLNQKYKIVFQNSSHVVYKL